jgi:HlyD family secretion protein
MKSKEAEKPDIADIVSVLGPKSPKRRSVWYVVGAVALAVALGAFFLVRGGSSSGATQYRTEEVRRGDLVVKITATGTLQPKNEVEVGSELSGTIRSVLVDYNSKVKTGQVLAKLDTTKLEATITQTKASLEAARAKVLQAQATVTETASKLAQYRKVRELSNGKTPSQADMDAAEAASLRARADVANCTAAVMQAEANLRANETDLAKSTITSPINGMVLTRSVEPGQTVAAAMTTPVLFKIAEDLAKIDLHVNVDEADVSGTKEGQKATFSVAAYPRRTFDATVTQVRFGSSTTSGVVTYETILEVDNQDLALRPGMTATADIIVKTVKDAVLVPSAALRFTPPAQEGTAAAKNTAAKKQSRGLVGSLLPGPPRRQQEEQPEKPVDAKSSQRLWVMKDGKLSPIQVVVGSTNGSVTEIAGGGVTPGTKVVIDVIAGTK